MRDREYETCSGWDTCGGPTMVEFCSLRWSVADSHQERSSTGRGVATARAHPPRQISALDLRPTRSEGLHQESLQAGAADLSRVECRAHPVSDRHGPPLRPGHELRGSPIRCASVVSRGLRCGDVVRVGVIEVAIWGDATGLASTRGWLFTAAGASVLGLNAGSLQGWFRWPTALLALIMLVICNLKCCAAGEYLSKARGVYHPMYGSLGLLGLVLAVFARPTRDA